MPQFDIPSQSSSSSCIVEVSALTWLNDSHNLFNFEASEENLHSKTFSVRGPTLFVRDQHEIETFPGGALSSLAKDEKLIQVVCDVRGKFALTRPRSVGQDERKMRLWRVIRCDHGAEHKLSEGDVIKFGRSQFRVRQISLNQNSYAPIDINSSCSPCCVDPATLGNHPDKPCRICLMDESTPDNPLLTPCQCKGSVEHVHLECLRHWVRGRLGLGDGDKAFTYKDLSCELCKTPYQTKIQKDGERMQLIDIASPFIIFESVTDGRQFVLPIREGSSAKIGRGRECDMNIHDTSISRLHSTIALKDGNFLLQDVGSKFGTFVKITKPCSLEDGKQITVQLGRTLLSFSSKQATVDSSDASCEEFMSATSSIQGEDDEECMETECLAKIMSCTNEIQHSSIVPQREDSDLDLMVDSV